jgi:hypothetical protein
MVGIRRLVQSGRSRLCWAALRSSSRRLEGWSVMTVFLFGTCNSCWHLTRMLLSRPGTIQAYGGDNPDMSCVYQTDQRSASSHA